MKKQHTSSLLSLELSQTRATIVKLLLAFGFATLTALSAQVKIPLPGTPVPATLQTSIVLLAGMVLGSGWGAVSMALYLLGGSLGLSFFAFSGAGIFGPTGGYLVGFMLAAFVVGRLVKKDHSFLRVYFSGLLASLFIFVPGVLQLKFFTAMNFKAAFLAGFVPFILGDLVKTALSAFAFKRLK